jgi:hypothetical protein
MWRFVLVYSFSAYEQGSRLFLEWEALKKSVRSQKLVAQGAYIWLSGKNRTKNDKSIVFLRDFVNGKYFYLTFCQEKGEQSSNTRFFVRFTTRLQNMSNVCNQSCFFSEAFQLD